MAKNMYSSLRGGGNHKICFSTDDWETFQRVEAACAFEMQTEHNIRYPSYAEVGFEHSQRVHSLDDLVDIEYIYVEGKIYSYEVFMFWTIRKCMELIDKHQIYKAIRKDMNL